MDDDNSNIIHSIIEYIRNVSRPWIAGGSAISVSLPSNSTACSVNLTPLLPFLFASLLLPPIPLQGIAAHKLFFQSFSHPCFIPSHLPHPLAGERWLLKGQQRTRAAHPSGFHRCYSFAVRVPLRVVCCFLSKNYKVMCVCGVYFDVFDLCGNWEGLF